MNPADIYRRAQRKKEMQKNKMKKKAAREANTFEDDAEALEEEIEKLERKEKDSHSASRKMELRMRKEALRSRLRSIPAHLRRGVSGEDVSVYLEGKKGRKKLDGQSKGLVEGQDLVGLMGDERRQFGSGDDANQEEWTDEFYTEEYAHLYGYDARGWPIPPPPPPLPLPVSKDGIQSHRPLPLPFHPHGPLMGPPHRTPVTPMAPAHPPPPPPPPPPPGLLMQQQHQRHNPDKSQLSKVSVVNDDARVESMEMKIHKEADESTQASKIEIEIDWSKKRRPVRKGIARTKVKAEVTSDVLAFVPTTMRMGANPDKKKRKIADSELAKGTEEPPKKPSASEDAYQAFMKLMGQTKPHDG
eukprot:TRINITY_DN27353_c0_g2_i1.p1 TRINITY_DN27353_c0_g2~~TRINITY_DN27353_c0_g2_i1.p1  ORF type:complete len:358 (+),score=135.20 TRINITY_DN27353_c0_g2_i1:333-1406(+)